MKFYHVKWGEQDVAVLRQSGDSPVPQSYNFKSGEWEDDPYFGPAVVGFSPDPGLREIDQSESETLIEQMRKTRVF